MGKCHCVQVSISVPGIDIDVERVNIAIPPKHEVTIKLYPELTLADPAIKTVPIVRQKHSFLLIIFKLIFRLISKILAGKEKLLL
jgi:hypothetical protein